MSHFHAYEPTLATALCDVLLIGVVCCAVLGLLMGLRGLFERLDRRADASTYADEEDAV
jgi:hypothetical protein